jgi:hypothetical protein
MFTDITMSDAIQYNVPITKPKWIGCWPSGGSAITFASRPEFEPCFG